MFGAMAREHINLKFSAKNSSILYSLLIMSCYILQLNPLQIHGLHHTNNSVQYMSSTSKQYRASHRTTPLFSLLRCSCSLTQKGMVGPFNGAHDLLHPIGTSSYIDVVGGEGGLFQSKNYRIWTAKNSFSCITAGGLF